MYLVIKYYCLCFYINFNECVKDNCKCNGGIDYFDLGCVCSGKYILL